MEPSARANAYGTTDELRDRLAASLDFAQRTVECADPLHPMWKVDLGQVSGFDKMMMEAGLFALLVARTEYWQDAAWSLARAIRKNYDSGSAIACILRHPRLATSIGALLLVLERFGLATEREVSVVHRALETEISFFERTRVRMRPLNADQIRNYLHKLIAAEGGLDFAGAYAIQRHGDMIIERTEGSYSNIVGLPVERLRATLEKLGVVH